MELLAGRDIELTSFLRPEEENPLGICIFHKFGASVVTLQEFIEESKIDLSPVMRQRYAGAFEIIAKQLRSR